MQTIGNYQGYGLDINIGSSSKYTGREYANLAAQVLNSTVGMIINIRKALYGYVDSRYVKEAKAAAKDTDLLIGRLRAFEKQFQGGSKFSLWSFVKAAPMGPIAPFYLAKKIYDSYADRVSAATGPTLLLQAQSLEKQAVALCKRVNGITSVVLTCKALKIAAKPPSDIDKMLKAAKWIGVGAVVLIAAPHILMAVTALRGVK